MSPSKIKRLFGWIAIGQPCILLSLGLVYIGEKHQLKRSILASLLGTDG